MRKKELPVYTIEDFTYSDMEIDFYANIISDHIKEHHHIILEPHRPNFYISILYTRGSGIQEIDFNSWDIVAGNVFMLSPGQVNSYKELSDDVEGYIFFHSKNFFDLNFPHERINHFPFFSPLLNSPLIRLEEFQFRKFDLRYYEIFEESKDNPLMKFEKLSSLVNVLYIELFRLYIPIIIKDTQNLKYLVKLTELEEILDKNFREIKYPKEYAKIMNISERHLNRICKVCLNKTTSELITDRIILEAKRMLVFSNNSISEIATGLGYLENSYFSRLFKKKCGKTPLEFLNTYRKY